MDEKLRGKDDRCLPNGTGGCGTGVPARLPQSAQPPMEALWALFGALILVVAMVVGALYLGWHMGRQQVVERVVVPAPDVSVAPAEIKVTQAASEVTIDPPRTLIVTPPPAPAEVHVLKEDTKAELGKIYERLVETNDLSAKTFEKVFAHLNQLTEMVGRNRAAIFSISAPEVRVEPGSRDPDGKLLPAPKE